MEKGYKRVCKGLRYFVSIESYPLYSSNVLIRCCPYRYTYEKWVRTSSIAAPPPPGGESKGGITGRQQTAGSRHLKIYDNKSSPADAHQQALSSG
jgi:hypothetical protein